LRDRVESDLSRWLAPFEDALTATNSSGEPDHRTRMRASGLVLDRVYGRPASQVSSLDGMGSDLNGRPIDEAINAEIELLSEELAEITKS
jgi:hypothetical protein